MSLQVINVVIDLVWVGCGQVSLLTFMLLAFQQGNGNKLLSSGAISTAPDTPTFSAVASPHASPANIVLPWKHCYSMWYIDLMI